MKKRLFSLLLVLCMALSLLPFGAAAADVGPDTALHSKAEIARYMAQYDYHPDADATFVTAPDRKNPPYRAGTISAQTRADALAIVNTIRYVAGLPAVTNDAEYEACAQAGALVNAVNDGLSHYPSQPANMSDEMYKQAYYGASNSNLSYGRRNLYESVVYGWMADNSSDSNLAAVGHRRWILSPRMAKTGFGIVPMNEPGNYAYSVTAMYVTDSSRNSPAETIIAWPARYTPYLFFSPYVPWSISVPQIQSPDAVAVTLQRRSDGRTWRFSKSSSDGHFSVSTANYGYGQCIIFQPDEGMDEMEDGCCVPGDSYTVTITGALSQTIRYTVEFFDPSSYGSDLKGWQQTGGSWKYYENGTAVTGWKRISNIWYYFNSAGIMQTGWQKLDGVWYYFVPSGAMVVGWQKINNVWYYFAPGGQMQTGWREIGGTWYYLKPSGAMAASEWCGGWWLNADGSWTYPYKGSWKQNSKGWWFGDESGWYARSATYRINDKLYSFDAAGYMK